MKATRILSIFFTALLISLGTIIISSILKLPGAFLIFLLSLVSLSIWQFYCDTTRTMWIRAFFILGAESKKHGRCRNGSGCRTSSWSCVHCCRNDYVTKETCLKLRRSRSKAKKSYVTFIFSSFCNTTQKKIVLIIQTVKLLRHLHSYLLYLIIWLPCVQHFHIKIIQSRRRIFWYFSKNADNTLLILPNHLRSIIIQQP